MHYGFPSDIRERLEAHLIGGFYQSEDDCIRDALDALDQIEQDKLLRWNERNAQAIADSRAGRSRPLDPEQVMNRLRERLARDGIFD